MPIDSLSTDPRLYVETTWADSVRALPEYTYTGTGPSVMDWILEKFFDVLREVLDGRADSLTDFVGYAVVIGTLVLLVFVITRRGASPLKLDRRGHVRSADGELAPAEDIDRMIGMAVSEQRYRDAVRLLYLRTLADLRERNMIQWHAEKTDSDYVRDLRGTWEHAETFAGAVRQFQRIWFGEQDVDAVAYAQVRAVFDELRGRA